VALDIKVQELEPGIAAVKVSGRLMLGPEGAQLETAVKDLLARGTKKIIFDFAELNHIDSTGIGRCIAALNMIMKGGGKLHVAAATGQVRDGFRITQLDRVFRFYDDVPAATAALR
jgi:anti-sigma B factor antagonist